MAHTLLQHPVPGRAAPRRSLYSPGRPVVTADPRTLGLFEAQPGRPSPTRIDAAAGGKGEATVCFMDPSTGAFFEMPLAALASGLAAERPSVHTRAANPASTPHQSWPHL
jgi:hypothetical protein